MMNGGVPQNCAYRTSQQRHCLKIAGRHYAPRHPHQQMRSWRGPGQWRTRAAARRQILVAGLQPRRETTANQIAMSISVRSCCGILLSIDTNSIPPREHDSWELPLNRPQAVCNMSCDTRRSTSDILRSTWPRTFVGAPYACVRSKGWVQFVSSRRLGKPFLPLRQLRFRAACWCSRLPSSKRGSHFSR